MDHPQAIVGLLRRPDGTLVVLTAASDGAKSQIYEVPNRDGDALWRVLDEVLGRQGATALPGSASAGPSAQTIRTDAAGKAYDDKLGKAYKTLLGEVERRAKDHWGAPVVDAAATVAADLGTKAKEQLAKVSRRGPSKLYELRRRAAARSG